jgi:hypothetical protein
VGPVDGHRESSVRWGGFTLTLSLAGAAWAGAATVKNGDDDGPGSFRAAIEAANGDPRVPRIRFARGLSVQITSDSMVYTGSQDLTLDGRGSEVVAAGDFDLFVSNGGVDLVTP